MTLFLFGILQAALYRRLFFGLGHCFSIIGEEFYFLIFKVGGVGVFGKFMKAMELVMVLKKEVLFFLLLLLKIGELGINFVFFL